MLGRAGEHVPCVWVSPIPVVNAVTADFSSCPSSLMHSNIQVPTDPPHPAGLHGFPVAFLE